MGWGGRVAPAPPVAQRRVDSANNEIETIWVRAQFVDRFLCDFTF